MSGAANIDPPATLIAIPPMINSEFCRFLLVHYRVPYVEQPHGFFFSFFCTLLHGRTVVAPLTYTASYALVGPEGIIGRLPAADDVSIPIQTQLIVELCSR